MKRCLSLALAALFTLSLCACGGVPQSDYDAVAAQRDDLQARLDAAQAEEDTVKTRVGGSFSATVRAVLPDYGLDTATPRAAVVTCFQSPPFVVLAGELAEGLTVGETYVFTLESPGEAELTRSEYLAGPPPVEEAVPRYSLRVTAVRVAGEGERGMVPEALTFDYQPPEEPTSAPAAAGDSWQRLLSTYHLPAEKLAGRTVTDPRGLLPEGASIDPAGLIETYSTATSGKAECLSLMDRLKAGEKLGDLLQSRGELYAIVTGPSGEEIGDALVRADTLEVTAYGPFPESPDAYGFRRDCILTEELKTRLEQSGLDLGKTAQTFCIINNFSNGALFSDGEKEFFVPTAESSANAGVMEVGGLYPVTGLPGLMEKALPDMFPPPTPHEDYSDGGSADVPLGPNEFPPVDALCDYLEQNLTEKQYSGITRQRGKYGLMAWVIVPDIAPVEALLADYSGRMVPIEYWVVPYSKAQLDKAVTDMEAFFADHPEIDHYPVGRFYNYVPVNLPEENSLVASFIESYPVKGIYHLNVHTEGLPANPD